MSIPVSISYSAFSAYCQCPFRYFKHYLKRIREQVNKYAFYGVVFHETIDNIYEKQNFFPSYAQNIFLENIQKEIKKPKNVRVTQKDLIEVRSKGIRDIATFFEMAKKEGILRPCIQHECEIEHHYRTSKLRAKIDLVTTIRGGIGIIDWKTGNPEDNNILQLALYAAIYEGKFNTKVDWLVPFYVKFKKVDYNPFDDAIKLKASKYFKETYDKIIKDTEFLPKQSSNCFFCMFSRNGECPLYPIKEVTNEQ